jgi:hypothetical protein
MSFKRDKVQALEWKTWLLKNRDELGACGVPPFVLEERRRWNYFLNHGYFTPEGIGEPIINVERMTDGERERLCTFLEGDNSDRESSVLNRLQYLLKRGRHAETPS